MTMFTWVLFGAAAGVVAALMDNKFTVSGLIGGLTLGVLGAAVGGLLADLVFYSGEGALGFSFISFLVSAVGALFLLSISKIFKEEDQLS